MGATEERTFFESGGRPLYGVMRRGLRRDAPLVLLDSPAVMKIVAFCEEEFDIAIPDEELIPDNFESVRTLARLIERIRSAQ